MSKKLFTPKKNQGKVFTTLGASNHTSAERDTNDYYAKGEPTIKWFN